MKNKLWIAVAGLSRNLHERVIGVGGLVLMLALPSLAANGPYRVDHWTTDKDLPQNSVRCLLQTRDGYLWIGTRGGLARFDGKSFTIFHRANTPEMKEDNCVDLAEDRDGTLWIATENGLLCWKDRRFNSWLAGPAGSAVALAHAQIRTLSPSRGGGVWIGTANGLDLLRNGTFTHFTTADGLQANNIRSVLEDARGDVWVGTEMHQYFGGLQRREAGAKQFVALTGQGTNLPFMVHCLFGETNGPTWWGNNAGLHCFSNGVTRDFHITNGLAGEVVRSVAPARDGGLWIVTGQREEVQGHRGLHKFKDGRITQLDLTSWGVEGELSGVLEDVEGNLWINTRQNGLFQLQPRVFHAFTVDEGLPHDSVNSVWADRDGAVWVATDKGLSEIRDDLVVSQPRYSFKARPVYCLLGDSSGGLCAGAYGPTLLVFDPPGPEPRTHFEDEGTFFKNDVTCLGGIDQREVWAGQPDGVCRAGFGGHIAIGQCFGPADGLPSNAVSVILRDRTNHLWLGTHGGGLCRLVLPPLTPINPMVPATFTNPPTWLKPRLRTFTTRDGLGSDFVRALYEDAEGVVWIGTDAGLSRHQKDRFATLGPREGLYDETINQILEDDLGYLWLGCSHGIYRVSRAELNAVAEGHLPQVHAVGFGESDGLPSSETSGRFQPAACKSADGRLWFPTVKGLAMVDPKNVQLNRVPPPVVIEQVRANDVVILGDSVAAEVSSLSRSSRKTTVGSPNSERRLAPGHGRLLEIHYTAITFMSPQKVRFKYRLDGSDDAWRDDDGNRRVAFYTNLRPGHYTFRVKACNNHGVWNEIGDRFSFVLLPHFYETWSFYGLCAAAVVLLGLGLHRVRVRVLSRIQGLEHQLAMNLERSRIAQDIHDDFGARLSQLSVLGELANRGMEAQPSAQPHLEKLRRTTAEIFLALDEIVWAVNPKQDSVAGLVFYLREFGPEFLAPSGVHCRLDFPNPVPAHPLSAEARHHLFLIVKEALNNVLKHAHATEVRLRLSLSDHTLQLCLEDNGKGFTPESSEPSIRNPEAKNLGNGLLNMRERMAQLGGQFHLETHPGRGTKIELRLPLGVSNQ